MIKVIVGELLWHSAFHIVFGLRLKNQNFTNIPYELLSVDIKNLYLGSNNISAIPAYGFTNYLKTSKAWIEQQ
jgi:Leucine-rich repeat (LRR) protein